MSPTPPDVRLTTSALSRLEKFPADQYMIAKGHDRLFYATPNGYAAVGLPAQVLADVTTGLVNRIVWASFGRAQDSWFFAFEMRDGTHTFKVGAGIPATLRQYIAKLKKQQIPLDTLRVQLGDNDSFVVWVQDLWASANIPVGLLNQLRLLSSSLRSSKDYTKGSLKIRPLENVQWLKEGSWFTSSGGVLKGNLLPGPARSHWVKFWKDEGDEDLGRRIQKEIAFVYLDPHARAPAFAYMKKKKCAADSSYFLVNLSQGTVLPGQSPDGEPVTASSVQSVPIDPGHPIRFQWATCTKSGRPHSKESWELEVKKGEKVKILRDMGRDWYFAKGKRNTEGWIHASWLEFSDRKLHTDPMSAYAKFEHDVHKMLVPGQLSSFPAMSSYMDSCTKPECSLLKGKLAALGICVHDLTMLLEGSGSYSYKWLKEGRNVWHPDRFARFCRPEHAERLKALAEEMFVLYGLLMEALPRSSGQ